MTKQLIVHDREYGSFDYTGGSILPGIVSETKYLHCKEGEKVAYFLTTNHRNHTLVVVPGIVASERYETRHHVPVIDIKPIKGSPLETEVAELLSKKEKGSISFWD